MTEPAWYDLETPQQVLGRIKRIALVAYVALAIIWLIFYGFREFLGLTCAAAVTMISFLWLEEIAEVVLQPVPQKVHARRLIVRTVARYALLGGALAVTIVIGGFGAVSVWLGFSIIVIGIFGEAVYVVLKGFAN